MKKPKWIIGIDEVGRGPLAGPVYVCATAMPLVQYQKTQFKGLTDSKLMTARSREAWFLEAQKLVDVGKLRYVLAERSAAQIDQKGIAVCIRSCVVEVLQKLKLDPRECLVLLDGGLKAPIEYVHQETVIKGDRVHKIISLASVIAKVARDKMMEKLHKKYAQYGWYQNKGYGTRAHRIAIKAYNITTFHRKSFLSRILDKI